MIQLEGFKLIAVALILFLPWAVMIGWWYVALVYYYLIHQKDSAQTGNFDIKILTTGDDVDVLTTTVNHSEKEPLVISRKAVVLPRGKVKVMPSDFSCAAHYKAQQLEWSRRQHPALYTLFIDEDSLCDLTQIPDADIVQFQEIPTSNNPLIGSIEAYRMGFQIEQALFEKTGPLYLWGGGVAIGRELEDATTWDRPTITEDTAFVYSVRRPIRFKFSKQSIYNQAPLCLSDLVKQRWRWSSGTLHDAKYLQNGWRKWFVYFRTLQWALWPFYTVAPLIFGLPFWLGILLPAHALVWVFVGTRVMKLGPGQTIAALFLSPIASYIHSFGSTIALVKPKKTFNRTPKRLVERTRPAILVKPGSKLSLNRTFTVFFQTLLNLRP